MEITENLANILKLFKKEHNLSLLEMASELEIAGSTLQDYLNGQGNPNIKTIEHIAAKMNMSPHLLVNNTLSDERRDILLPLYESVLLVKQLEDSKRERFFYLFAQLVAL